MKFDNYVLSSKNNPTKEDLINEIQRLAACYQIASRDDKNVVWAALNKYLPLINAR